MSIYFLLFWSSLLAASLAAFRWGGPPEKAVACMYLLAAAATLVVEPALGVRYRQVELGVFLIDACLLAGLVFVSIRADRWWPLCATALQILAVLSHVGKAVNPGLWRYGYQLMAVWTAWPTVGLLAFGVLRNRRRERMRAGT
ncbi:hypothetical protein [Sphingomonas faeni]|uniref:hypothetical protein n=1 Tax=Sphingomonas faeni TaxID=185950 RepID=UPI00335FB81F